MELKFNNTQCENQKAPDTSWNYQTQLSDENIRLIKLSQELQKQ